MGVVLLGSDVVPFDSGVLVAVPCAIVGCLIGSGAGVIRADVVVVCSVVGLSCSSVDSLVVVVDSERADVD